MRHNMARRANTRWTFFLAMLAAILLPVTASSPALGQDDGLTQREELTELNYTTEIDAAGQVTLAYASEESLPLETLIRPGFRGKSKKSGLLTEPTPAAEIAFAWSAGSDSGVALAWTPVTGAVKQEVYRDSVLLGEASNSSWTDLDAKPGVIHEYKIIVEMLLASDASESPDAQTAPHPERAASVSIVTNVLVPRSASAKMSAKQVESTTVADAVSRLATTTTSRFRYQTFISPNTAPGFPCVTRPTNTHFAGDNRGWGATSNKFRTRSIAAMHWPSGGLSAGSLVGATILRSSAGVELSRKTASTNKMYFKDATKSATKASFRFDHSASNPYCSLGQAICYGVSVSLYKAGSYVVSGYRRQAPHHEAYVQADDGPWKTVLRLTNTDFKCLAAALCSTQSLGYSG